MKQSKVVKLEWFGIAVVACFSILVLTMIVSLAKVVISCAFGSLCE